MRWHVPTFAGGAVDSPALAAFMAGLYLAAFYVTNNLTMLSGASLATLLLIFTIPITVVVASIAGLLGRLGKETLGPTVCVSLCVAYLVFSLRGTVFHIDAIRHFFDSQNAVVSTVAKLVYYTVPTILLTFLFRTDVRKLTAVLGTMTIATVAMSAPSIWANLSGEDNVYGRYMREKFGDATLSQTPNVYFILADGYGSFAHLHANGIDVTDFRNSLRASGFRLYDDMFSNYHPTTASLPAMLNMDHHYYSFSVRSEVTKFGRMVTAGRNNLVYLLRRHGYQIQYVHAGSYLLLHGCSADVCFGVDSLFGARTVLNKVLPDRLQIREVLWLSHDKVKDEVDRLLDTDLPSGTSRFQYIHVYRPTHAPNARVGTCNRAQEIEEYSNRVSSVNEDLIEMIDSIIARDPMAVIMLAGDHGPFIENKCERYVDVSTLADVRDRVGILTAIRWPSEYDGRYDDRMRTSVNSFRYLLASMADDDASFLNTAVSDDVYLQGVGHILKVIEDGKVLSTVRTSSKEELRDAHGIR